MNIHHFVAGGQSIRDRFQACFSAVINEKATGEEARGIIRAHVAESDPFLR